MLSLALGASVCCGGSPAPAAPTASVSTPPPAANQPPKPLDSATIAITAAGFGLVTASPYPLSELHVYQGGTLTFVNNDVATHDVLSDPPHVHTDCPEINLAGFLVPGQSRATGPLNRLVTCGFHDHTHEGDAAFSGKVVVEAR
ncbi:MAG: hypothetical protein U0Q12_07305 [Vicinamibacterales bacterium]